MSYTIVSDELQDDGRFWVTETHTLTDGSTQQFYYLAAKDADVKAIALQREVDIVNGQLVR